MKNTITIVALAAIIVAQLLTNQPNNQTPPVSMAMVVQATYTPRPTFTATPQTSEYEAQMATVERANAQIQSNPPTLRIVTTTPLPQPQHTPTAMPVLPKLPGASSYGIDNFGVSVFDMPGVKSALAQFGNHNLTGDGVVCLSAFPHGDFAAVGQDETLKIIANDNSSGYDIVVPKLRKGCVSHPDGLFVAANSEAGALIVPRRELGFADPYWIVAVGFDKKPATAVGWAGELLVLEADGVRSVYNPKTPRLTPITVTDNLGNLLEMRDTWVLPYSNK